MPRKTRASDPRPRTKVKAQPVETRRANPEAFKVAKKLAGGDPTRLTIGKDGSVTAWNNTETATQRRKEGH